MKEAAYVIYLQSWFDIDKPETKQYLKIEKKPDQVFDRVWRRNGVWVDKKEDATIIGERSKADQIACYYGVAFEEIV